MEIHSQKNGEATIMLKNAYEALKIGAFGEAGEILEIALSYDFDNAEVISALKSSGYWSERERRYNEIEDSFERGEYLMNQWEAFLAYLDRGEDSFEQGKYCLKQWVFGKALGDFRTLLDGPAGSDPEILYKIGRCYKGQGNYRQALEYLEASNHQKTDDPKIIAELADCYAFINETQAAKVFFREAFFIDPQKIDLNTLESKMIRRLIDKLKDLGFEGSGLAEWIPVYGVLFGVFNVKRELRSLEYGKLKQSIFTLQSQLAGDGKNEIETEPRLINRYFWLIDHYISTGDAREKVDEALEKIRLINSDIYAQYTQ
jgi:tetratricopeptide (TPR) repeat protein